MRHPRLGRLAILLSASFAITLAAAGPASAAATTDVHLNPGQRGNTAAGFTDNCDQIPGGRKAGVDGWVFVLPGNQGTLVSLHLTFNDGSKNVVIDVPGSSYPNGIVTNGADKAYVVLPAGWTIVDGNGTATNPQHDKFNVTHVCRAGSGSGSGQGSNSGPGAGSGSGNSAGTGPATGSGSGNGPATGSGSGAGSGPATGNGSGSATGSGSGVAEGSAVGTVSTSGVGSRADVGAGTAGKLGGALPTTGTAIMSLVAVGLGLVAVGVAVLVMRRRGSLTFRL